MKFHRYIPALALLASLVFNLSACASSPASQVDPSAPTVQPVPVSASQVAPGAPTVEPVPASASPTPTPTASQPARSPRGNLIKVVGQPAGQSNPVTKKQTVNFTINSITVDPPCTAPYSRPAEKGHFVILDASIETLPELAEMSSPRFDLSPHTFKYVAANGTTYNGSLATGASYGCLPDADVLSINGVGPAEKVTGKIVLDVPDTTGVLVFQPNGAGTGGWEWAF